MNALKGVNLNIIKNYIKENNLTNKKFCELCKISTSSFYKIFKGKSCNVESFSKISKFSKIPLADLFLDIKIEDIN